MSKLCLIYNFAQRYRTAIFSAIDKQWECEWYFGKNTTDIKGMDISVLKNATVLNNKTIRGPWFYQPSVAQLAGRKDISTFFVLGDPHCLSNWLLGIKLKFFHPKKRLYFWTHGWYGKESRLTSLIKKTFFRLADGIFLYGNHARKLMIEQGFDKDKLFVIHNSLDYATQLALRNSISASDIYKKHFGNDNHTLVFIGRLTEVKKLDMVLKALNVLKQKGKNLNMVFVGNGTEKKSLEDLTEKLGLTDHVWFYGACYDETTNAELIYNADLCVAPGNVGLTAMHSMVFGTPVISHDDFKWQMPEFEAIIQGKTGDFFRNGDVEDLARKIEEWFDSHPSREAVREACYNEIDNFWTPDFQMDVLKKNLKV